MVISKSARGAEMTFMPQLCFSTQVRWYRHFVCRIAFVAQIVCSQIATLQLWGKTAVYIPHHCEVHNKQQYLIVIKSVGFMNTADNYCGGWLVSKGWWVSKQPWPTGWSRGERTASKYLINKLEINKELILSFVYVARVGTIVLILSYPRNIHTKF